MTDEANATPSNGAASEDVQSDVQNIQSTPAADPVVETTKPPSTREALDKAFKAVLEPKADNKDRGDGRNDRGQFASKEGEKPAEVKADSKPPEIKAIEPPKPEAKPAEAAPKPVA